MFLQNMIHDCVKIAKNNQKNFSAKNEEKNSALLPGFNISPDCKADIEDCHKPIADNQQ